MVTMALKDTIHRHSSLWVQRAFRFIAPLLIRQRHEICSCMDSASKSSGVPESPAKLERFKIKTSEKTLIENANKKATELLSDSSLPLVTHILTFIRLE